MGSDKTLLVTVKDGVARITFNRPERRNAVDFEAMQLFHDAIQQAADDDTKVIVLTGAGDAFCAGADLQARTPEQIKSYDVTAGLRKHTTPAILTMNRISKPVIARIHGPAAGIGFSYALAADIRIASEQAKFSMGFVKIGLIPDGGSTYFLPRLVGYSKAFELMATGNTIGAAEALSLGLVNQVVPVEKLDSVVDALVETFRAAPAIALGKIKAALTRSQNADLASALEFEAVNQADCFHSEDFLEGVNAFLQKRKASFQGR
jgi:2-(1,2-epoxy-1,2-dihydrophenyl)acetyl-CoA isomerase